MSDKKSCLLSGSIAANPLLVLLLGAGPALAATGSVLSALSMGLAVLLVMLLSNLLAAVLGNVIPCSAKLPAYAIIGAGVASLVQMLLQAFLPAAAQMLGVYLAVLAVDLVVFAGAEASAKGGVKTAVGGSVKTAVFFTVVMVGVALVREVLGAGSVAGFALPLLKDYNLPLLQTAAGGFMVYGVAAAIVSKCGCCCEKKGIAAAAVGYESCCCNTEKEEA